MYRKRSVLHRAIERTSSGRGLKEESSLEQGRGGRGHLVVAHIVGGVGNSSTNRWRDPDELVKCDQWQARKRANSDLIICVIELRDARPDGTPDRETNQPWQLQHPDLGQDRERGQVSGCVQRGARGGSEGKRD